jgi:hypothetical protein
MSALLPENRRYFISYCYADDKSFGISDARLHGFTAEPDTDAWVDAVIAFIKRHRGLKSVAIIYWKELRTTSTNAR